MFGGRPCPKIFERFATATEDIALKVLALSMLHHYLDDFVGGARTFSECSRQARAFEALLETLGWRNNVRKAEGPAQLVKVLGVLIDTGEMQARVTPERLDEISSLIRSFCSRSSCSVKDLKSLLGKLF